MRIECVADHLDRIDQIARWHWDEWGDEDPDGSLESWAAGLRERTYPDRIPTGFVALEGERLIGTVTLVVNDMHTRPELWPWLAGLFVPPDARGRGIASALVRHAVAKADEMGVPKLYLYTSDASGLYRKLGWTEIDRDFYDGGPVTVMEIETAPRQRRG